MKVLLITHDVLPERGGWSRYARILRDELRVQHHDARSTQEVLGGSEVRELRRPMLSGLAHWPSSIRRIRMAIERFRPDIVHVIDEPYALLLPFVNTRDARVVLTVHGTYAYPPALANGLKGRFFHVIFALALRKVSKIIAVSVYTKELLLSRARKDHCYINAEKIAVVPNGVSFLDDTQEFERHSNNFTILTVAPVKARKGILEVVRSLGILKRRGVNFTYRVVGTIDESESYAKLVKKEVEEHGLKDRVVFLGRVSEETLRKEYKNASVFIMLPVAHGLSVEGFGLVYLEANAYGIPSIGSYKSGAEEAIAEGESGFLVDPSDSNAVASALENVRQGQLSESGAREWAYTHRIENVSREIVSLYESLLEP